MLFLLCALFYSASVYAGCVENPNGFGNANCVTEAEAQIWVANNTNQVKKCTGGSQYTYTASATSFDGSNTNRIANLNCTLTSNGDVSQNYLVAVFTEDCSAQNATSNATLSFQQWPACRGGCAVQDSGHRTVESTYRPTGQPAYVVTFQQGVVQFTGNVCQTVPETPPPPDVPPTPDGEDTCASVGNLTQCQKPNGDMCATASNGVQHCWDPAAPPVIPTVSPDGSVTVNNTATPADAPPGQPVQGTINNSTTINNTTINSSVTVSGTPAAGGGDTGGSGTCPTGQTGTPPNCVATGGGGTNTTPAPQACPAGVDCTGAGSATGPMGVVYTKGTDTIGSVISGHFDDIANYPIVNAAQEFLGTDCFLEGACPALNMAASEYLGEVASDAFCSPAGTFILSLAGYVLLAGASYAAFRIAIDN